MPEWRNWQTRQLEGLVGFFLVQVQILSPALFLTLLPPDGTDSCEANQT